MLIKIHNSELQGQNKAVTTERVIYNKRYQETSKHFSQACESWHLVITKLLQYILTTYIESTNQQW